MIFTQSEGTAARCRFPLYLVDATDGITPETGEAAGQPQISKAGGAWANTTATLTALGNGAYYVELTSTELNTLGPIQVRYKSANTAEFNAPGVVVAYNQHDAVRLGVTALPNAAAEAAGGLFTRGTGAGQINQAANGQVDVNATHFAGTAYATAAAALDDAVIAAIAALNNLSAAQVNAEADTAIADAALATAANLAAAKAVVDAVKAVTDLLPNAGALTSLATAANLATVAGYLDTEIASIIATLGSAGAGLTGIPDSAGVGTLLTRLSAIRAGLLDNLDAAITSRASASALATAQTSIDDLPTNAELATSQAAADDATLAAIAALNNLSAAQVNAEVVDALRTDTGTEVSAVPAAAAPIGAQLQYLYQGLRNKVDVTATAKEVHNDAGTVVGTKTLSDDGTTYSESKAV